MTARRITARIASEHGLVLTERFGRHVLQGGGRLIVTSEPSAELDAARPKPPAATWLVLRPGEQVPMTPRLAEQELLKPFAPSFRLHLPRRSALKC